MALSRGSDDGVMILRSDARVGRLRAVHEVWGFRGTVLAFAERDVRVKYKQAVFGVAWAVLQPLLFMAIFTRP